VGARDGEYKRPTGLVVLRPSRVPAVVALPATIDPLEVPCLACGGQGRCVLETADGCPPIVACEVCPGTGRVQCVRAVSSVASPGGGRAHVFRPGRLVLPALCSHRAPVDQVRDGDGTPCEPCEQALREAQEKLRAAAGATPAG
jgi:hypothetical protein